jgi:hypothetical protein
MVLVQSVLEHMGSDAIFIMRAVRQEGHLWICDTIFYEARGRDGLWAFTCMKVSQMINQK